MSQTNDAIAKCDCKLAIKCCLKPDWRNQFGAKQCWCFNCGRRCSECYKPYIEKGLAPRGEGMEEVKQ